jgi:hypothetical protein
MTSGGFHKVAPLPLVFCLPQVKDATRQPSLSLGLKNFCCGKKSAIILACAEDWQAGRPRSSISLVALCQHDLALWLIFEYLTVECFLNCPCTVAGRYGLAFLLTQI